MCEHLVITVHKQIHIHVYDKDIVETLVIAERHFFLRDDPPSDLIFYDWVIDGEEVSGIEIHCSLDDPRIASRVPLKALDEVELSPYPRIWFNQKRFGKPMGCEAFGDLRFFADAEGHLAIVVGLDNWLTDEQRGAIRELVSKTRKEGEKEEKGSGLIDLADGCR